MAKIGNVQSLLGVAPVMAADCQGSPLHGAEPGQHAKQRGFAGAVRPRQQQGLTGRERQARSIQNKAQTANHGCVMQDEPGRKRRGKT